MNWTSINPPHCRTLPMKSLPLLLCHPLPPFLLSESPQKSLTVVPGAKNTFSQTLTHQRSAPLKLLTKSILGGGEPNHYHARIKVTQLPVRSCKWMDHILIKIMVNAITIVCTTLKPFLQQLKKPEWLQRPLSRLLQHHTSESNQQSLVIQKNHMHAQITISLTLILQRSAPLKIIPI